MAGGPVEVLVDLGRGGRTCLLSGRWPGEEVPGAGEEEAPVAGGEEVPGAGGEMPGAGREETLGAGAKGSKGDKVEE